MLKTSENDIRLCHVFAFHYDVKGLFFHFLTFKRSSNPFDTTVAQASGTVLLVNYLKTSSVDSVTTCI